MFDLLWTPPHLIMDSVRALRKNLEEFGPNDRIAILTLSDQARLVHSFTINRDHTAIGLDVIQASLQRDRRAVAVHTERLAAARAENGEGRSASLGLRGALAIGSPVGLSLSGLPDSTLVSDRPLSRFAQEDDVDFSLVELAEQNVISNLASDANDSFAQMVRVLSDVPGPHYAMLFSRGMPDFRSILEAWNTGAGASLLGSFQSLAFVLEGNGWVVQAFDLAGVGGRGTNFDVATGPRPEQNALQFSEVPDLALRGGLADASSDTLLLLAKETGGEIYSQYNRVGNALKKSLERTSHHYQVVVSLPQSERFFERRRSLRVHVDGLPRRASVSKSFAADWALPKNLRRETAVDRVRAELVLGSGTSGVPRHQARLGVYRMPWTGSLHRVVFALQGRQSIYAGSGLRLGGGAVVHALAQPLPGTSGDFGGSFFDLWDGMVRWSDDRSSRDLLIAGDLLIPCQGAEVRVRIAAADEGESYVFKESLADACSQDFGWVASIVRATDDTTYLVESGFSFKDELSPFFVEGQSYVPQLMQVAMGQHSMDLLQFDAGNQVTAGDAPLLELRLIHETSGKVTPTFAQLQTWAPAAGSSGRLVSNGDRVLQPAARFLHLAPCDR